MRIIRRKSDTLLIPEVIALPSALVGDSALEDIYSGPYPSVDAVLRWSAELRQRYNAGERPDYPELQHPLSRVLYADVLRNGDEETTLADRTEREATVLLELRHVLQPRLLAGPETFIDTLKEVHHHLAAGVGEWREGAVSTLADSQGRRIAYPTAAEALIGLQQLGSALSDRRFSNVSGAMIAYAMINNLHPFTDGNGRLARTIFNALASPPTGELQLLPLFEIAGLSRKGHTVALRLARYRGDWDPMQRFLIEARRLICRAIIDRA